MKKTDIQPRQELIIYNNDFNKMNIKGLTPISYNLLIGLFKYFKDKNEYIFTKDELMDIAFGSSDIKRNSHLLEAIKNAEKNFLRSVINIKKENNKTFEQLSMVLFTTVYSKVENNEVISLHIELNNNARKIFQILSNQYTCVDFLQFKSIRSVYTKTLYRLLCQYKRTGVMRISLEEFKRILDIPESYLLGNIKQRILEPSINELDKFFINLGYDIDKKNDYLITFKFEKIKTISQEMKDKFEKISILKTLNFIDDNKIKSDLLNYTKEKYYDKKSI